MSNSTIDDPSLDVEDDIHSPYGYVPHGSIALMFIALFGLSGIIHIIQALYWRLYWMIFSMGLGCIGEVIGWAARYMSSKTPAELNPFLIQTVCTVISPSFMSAANFSILALIIRRLGFQYSRLTPRWYLIVFIGFDVGALVIQSVGGAKAASAAKKHQSAEPGAKIMLYGIILQMIALCFYVILGAEFVTRYLLNKPVRPVTPPPSKNGSSSMIEEKIPSRPPLDKDTKTMLIGLIINVIFFFIRTIYRTIELNAGWDGPIITNELLFNVLDGAQIVLCTYTFNFIHPGYFLRAKPNMYPNSA